MSEVRRTSLPALAGAAILAVAGCGGAASDTARLEAAVDTADGVERLTYPETPAPALGWRFDTLAVIGGYGMQAAEYQFDQVSPGGVVGGADGTLYVLDGAGSRVLGYAPDGSFVGEWGGEGEGPGEIRNPSGLGVEGDTLWVVDSGNRRLTLLPLDPQGEPADVAFPGSSSSLAGRILPGEGGAWGVLATFSFRPGEDTGPPPRPLLKVNRDGSLGDTVWTAPPPEFDQIELSGSFGNLVLWMQPAFSPVLAWARFLDGTFAVSYAAEYEVRQVRPDGAEIRRIRREPAPRPTTEADRARIREQLREAPLQGNFPGEAQLREKQLEKMTFAGVIPRITGLAVDTRGRLWVGVSEETPGEADRIDIYDAGGRLLGELRDPPFLPTTFYGDDLAAYLTKDDLDVQQVVVLRLVEEPERG